LCSLHCFDLMPAAPSRHDKHGKFLVDFNWLSGASANAKTGEGMKHPNHVKEP
jgi:hypothetical protein